MGRFYGQKSDSHQNWRELVDERLTYAALDWFEAYQKMKELGKRPPQFSTGCDITR